MSKSILVIFGKKPPKKRKSWWQQFDKVIVEARLQQGLQQTCGSMASTNLEQFISPGSVQDAHRLFCRIPKITEINYGGYELWWVHHDDIYHQFCLPYTQYKNLLNHLKSFKKVYLYQPPFPHLFKYFLEAHDCRCIIYGKKRFFPSLGILIQILISFISLFWLKITRPQLMLWTSDRFALPHRCDFRMVFIYEELRKRKIAFVEFIRSLESWSTILSHAWQRKRPVIYSSAIINFVHFWAGFLAKKKFSADGRLEGESHSIGAGEHDQRFWFSVSAHYLHNIRGTIWSILAMKFLLRLIGVKRAIIANTCNRTVHEVLACKLLGIETIGIMHGGAVSRYYDVYDFMPGFGGQNMLSVDRYGLWSEWWRKYYLAHSQAYKPEQLFVSGPMRPPQCATPGVTHNVTHNGGGPVKVLFISEGLAAPQEIMPYLSGLLEMKEINLHVKFRPYRDGFELWLKNNQPEVYKKMLKKTKILRGSMDKAIFLCDVAVGSHSTAVLEALWQLKPFIFFWTNKWGDHFNMRSTGLNDFFAGTPGELIERIEKCAGVPKLKLKELQKIFLGNPYQNGSKWVVDQVEKL